MINSLEFNKKISEFEKEEGRGIIFWRAKEIMSKSSEFDTDACLLILTTWNFAHMSSFFKKVRGNKFNYNLIKDSIEQVKPYLKIFGKESIKSADLKKLEENIKKIYELLQKNKQINSVGASKILMLLNDNIFVAWDNAIIKHYSKRLPKGKTLRRKDGESYFRFLQLMQKTFDHIELDEQNIIVNGQNKGWAKAIDEYNFLTVPR